MISMSDSKVTFSEENAEYLPAHGQHNVSQIVALLILYMQRKTSIECHGKRHRLLPQCFLMNICNT